MYKSVLLIIFFSYFTSSTSESNLTVESKIVGGRLTTIERFPFNAVIQLQFWNFWIFNSWESVCGGAIISEKFVLTLASCCVKYEARVLAGSGNISPFYQDDAIIYPVARVFPHSNYDPKELTVNNLAVLEVTRHFEFNNGTLRKIAILNDTNPNIAFSKIYKFGEVIGFGVDVLSFWSRQTLVPKRADINFTMITRCRLYNYKEVICLKGVNGHPCFEDFGGPVVVQINSVEYLAGLVTEVTKNCGKFSRAVRLSAYSQFVNQYALTLANETGV